MDGLTDDQIKILELQYELGEREAEISELKDQILWLENKYELYD